MMAPLSNLPHMVKSLLNDVLNVRVVERGRVGFMEEPGGCFLVKHAEERNGAVVGWERRRGRSMRPNL